MPYLELLGPRYRRILLLFGECGAVDQEVGAGTEVQAGRVVQDQIFRDLKMHVKECPSVAKCYRRQTSVTTESTVFHQTPFYLTYE